MTIGLGWAIALVLVAVFSGALGLSGTRCRGASVARMLFYAILLGATVSLMVGILGVMEII